MNENKKKKTSLDFSATTSLSSFFFFGSERVHSSKGKGNEIWCELKWDEKEEKKKELNNEILPNIPEFEIVKNCIASREYRRRRRRFPSRRKIEFFGFYIFI